MGLGVGVVGGGRWVGVDFSIPSRHMKNSGGGGKCTCAGEGEGVGALLGLWCSVCVCVGGTGTLPRCCCPTCTHAPAQSSPTRVPVRCLAPGCPQGVALMSVETEEVGEALAAGAIPRAWLTASFPFLGSVGQWVNDLVARVAFFQDWVLNGQPKAFWMSGACQRRQSEGGGGGD